MDNQIFEEAPTAPVAGGDSARQIEKQARQLAYDTRYYVKKQLGGKPVNVATMERLLMARLQKSTAVPAVKARAKEMLIGKMKNKAGVAEDYNIEELAANTMAKTLYKVFVEGASKKLDIELDYIEELFSSDREKFKVRVTDTKKGTSYVRFADLKKITELRLKGLKVEKTEHGDPREDEAKHGSQTAAALGGGEKSKKDYDGDGKVESGAKEYRGAVHNAIQRRKGGTPDGQDTSSVKEEFLGEINSEDSSSARKVTVTGTGVNNGPLIKVFPDEKSDGANVSNAASKASHLTAGYDYNGSLIVEKGNSLSRFRQLVIEKAESEQQQKLFGLALSVKRGETPRSEVSAEVLKIVDTMSEKEIRKFAKTKHEGLPKKVAEAKETDEGEERGCEDDPRAAYSEREVIKNKLRAALGVKNPIVMTAGYEPEGEQLDENPLVKAALAAGGLYAATKGMEGLKSSFDKKIKDARKTSPIGGDKRVPQMNSYELDGEVISEREFDEPGEEDWRPDVRAHNRALGYPGGYAGYGKYRRGPRRPRPENPGPGSQAKPAD